MKSIRSLSIVAWSASLLVCAWSARGQNFYFDTQGGVALAEKVDLKSFLTPTPGAKLEFDPGPHLSVAGGYNICPYFGAQLETGFTYNNIKNVTGSSDIDGSLSHVPLLTDLVFRYDKPDCHWVPYAGAGFGGDLSVIELDTVRAPNGAIVDGSDSSLVFAWQVFAGVRYKFNQNMSLGGGYKFYWADGASWDVHNSPGDIEAGKAQVHSFGVDFNIQF